MKANGKILILYKHIAKNIKFGFKKKILISLKLIKIFYSIWSHLES